MLENFSWKHSRRDRKCEWKRDTRLAISCQMRWQIDKKLKGDIHNRRLIRGWRFLYENYSELSNLRAKLGGFVYHDLQWYLIKMYLILISIIYGYHTLSASNDNKFPTNSIKLRSTQLNFILFYSFFTSNSIKYVLSEIGFCLRGHSRDPLPLFLST